MPTVEADVAFGLGKFDLSYDQVKSRVAKALDAVGMSDYSQVRLCFGISLLKLDVSKDLNLMSQVIDG